MEPRVPSELPFRNPEQRESSSLGSAPGGGGSETSQTCRLAVILAADVAGYSRLIGEADEAASLERLKALHRRVIDPKIADHHRPCREG